MYEILSNQMCRFWASPQCSLLLVLNARHVSLCDRCQSFLRTSKRKGEGEGKGRGGRGGVKEIERRRGGEGLKERENERASDDEEGC